MGALGGSWSPIVLESMVQNTKDDRSMLGIFVYSST